MEPRRPGVAATSMHARRVCLPQPRFSSLLTRPQQLLGAPDARRGAQQAGESMVRWVKRAARASGRGSQVVCGAGEASQRSTCKCAAFKLPPLPPPPAAPPLLTTTRRRRRNRGPRPSAAPAAWPPRPAAWARFWRPQRTAAHGWPWMARTIRRTRRSRAPLLLPAAHTLTT